MVGSNSQTHSGFQQTCEYLFASRRNITPRYDHYVIRKFDQEVDSINNFGYHIVPLLLFRDTKLYWELRRVLLFCSRWTDLHACTHPVTLFTYVCTHRRSQMRKFGINSNTIYHCFATTIFIHRALHFCFLVGRIQLKLTK